VRPLQGRIQVQDAPTGGIATLSPIRTKLSDAEVIFEKFGI